MKFLGLKKIVDVLVIVGLIYATKKEDSIISLVGHKEELNNIQLLNKPKQDVKLSDMHVVDSHYGQEDGELDLVLNLLNPNHKKHLSYGNADHHSNVIKDMIMFIFLDGLKTELNNIMTEILV